MEDILIKCVECKEEFNFSVGEQEFYKERDYSNPKRCKSCRDKKRNDRY